MKELELTSLDRIIAEEKQKLDNQRVIERLVGVHFRILDALWLAKILNEDTWEKFRSICPYCGAEGDKKLEYQEGPKKHEVGVQHYLWGLWGED